MINHFLLIFFFSRKFSQDIFEQIFKKSSIIVYLQLDMFRSCLYTQAWNKIVPWAVIFRTPQINLFCVNAWSLFSLPCFVCKVHTCIVVQSGTDTTYCAFPANLLWELLTAWWWSFMLWLSEIYFSSGCLCTYLNSKRYESSEMVRLWKLLQKVEFHI